MASLDDFKNVIKETLDKRGVLNQIRARIRAEVFSALDDQSNVKPLLSNENLFINELIREYLEYNNYNYTSAVFLAETGQPKDQMDRRFLASELPTLKPDGPSDIPILYQLVSSSLNQNSHAVKGHNSRRKKSQQRSPSNDEGENSTMVDYSKGKHATIYHAPPS